MNRKILIIIIICLKTIQINAQIHYDCPDWSCLKSKFIVGLSNNILEEAAKKHHIKSITVKNGKYNVAHFKFDDSGNLVERNYGFASTTKTNYYFKYDSLDRVIFSKYYMRGCFDMLHCIEKYTYNNDGTYLKVLETDIADVYEIDSLNYESPRRIKVGEKGTRIAYFDEKGLTQIQYYKRGVRGINKLIVLDQDTTERNRIIKLVSEIDKNYSGQTIFNDWAWRNNIQSSIMNEPNSEEIMIDIWKRKWKFQYDNKGLRAKEFFDEQDEEKSTFGAASLEIQYEFYN